MFVGTREELFDWQMLVRRREVGGLLECRGHGAEVEAQDGKKAKERLWHFDYNRHRLG